MKTNWTEREKRDFDLMKTDTNYYDRRLLVSQILNTEITVMPAYWNGHMLMSEEGPIVPLSVADAEALVVELNIAIKKRKRYLELTP